LKTTRRPVFALKAEWRGATKENTLGGSATEEQRSQAALGERSLENANKQFLFYKAGAFLSSLGKRLMSVEIKEHIWTRDGNARPLIAGKDEPIFVGPGVKAAKNLTPRKLSLTGEVGADNALVERAALRIVGRIPFIERMGVC